MLDEFFDFSREIEEVIDVLDDKDPDSEHPDSDVAWTAVYQ